MDQPIYWLFLAIILAFVQAAVLVLRLSANKKNNPGKYGERIAKLETKVENIEEDIRDIKEKLNRK